MIYMDGLQDQTIPHAVWYQMREHGVRLWVGQQLHYHQHRWRAKQVRQVVSAQDQADIKTLTNVIWPLTLTPNALRFSMRSPAERPLRALWARSENNAGQWTLWRRIWQPVWLGLFVVWLLLTLPAQGGRLSPRQGLWGGLGFLGSSRLSKCMACFLCFGLGGCLRVCRSYCTVAY